MTESLSAAIRQQHCQLLFKDQQCLSTSISYTVQHAQYAVPGMTCFWHAEPQAAEFNGFNPMPTTASGQLDGAIWSQAPGDFTAFTGFYLYDKTNVSAPLADKLMCNSTGGTYDFTPASTLTGNRSLILMPSDGGMNVSALIYSVNPGLNLYFKNLWAESLKVSPT